MTARYHAEQALDTRRKPQLKRPPRRSPTADEKRAARRILSASRFAHYFTRPLLGAGPMLIGAALLAATYWGWSNRQEEHIAPDTGLGYWLGIAGSLMMLALLLYPLRKHVRFMRAFGRVPSWFRLHMLLGVLGPTLILFHANFRMQSLNASVATFFMLTIVASGIIGRYLYAKVHKGLYGSKAELRGILQDADLMKEVLGEDLSDTSWLMGELDSFEAKVFAPHRSFLSSLWAFVSLGYRWQRTRERVLNGASLALKKGGLGWWARRKRLSLIRAHLKIYYAAVNKAARFGVYERLFALWHVLHMPLFFLLVFSAILHVVAVHLY